MTIDEAYQVSGLQKIEVDINSLSDFADVMRREFQNLQNVFDAIDEPLGRGPQFGFDPSLDLGEKRSTYHTYLAQARELLQNVIKGTEQLSYAADQIAANYSRADQFAKVQAADVNKILPEIKADRPGPSGPLGARRAI
jgi:hypothetical protein